MKVWDAITGSPLHSFPHKHVVKTVDWSPNSRRLATGGNEGVLRVFDILHPDKDPLEFIQNKDEVCVIGVFLLYKFGIHMIPDFVLGLFCRSYQSQNATG